MTRKLLTVDAVGERINSAINLGQPFSFLRLGDGEGELLRFSADAEIQDCSYFCRHFGNDATISTILRGRSNLEQAIASADLVGVRDDVVNALPSASTIDKTSEDFLPRFLESFPLREAERAHMDLHKDSFAARRIFHLWEWYSQWEPAHSQEVSSQWVHIDLQMRHFWEDLIASQAEISLISSMPQLARNIEARFGVRVELIEIPTQDPNQKKQMDARQEIAARIGPGAKGKVFFVAGGLAAKHYCDIVKRNDGIAIDIGALTDAWDGRPTRPMVALAKAPLTSSSYAPPPALRSLFPQSPSPHIPNKQLIFHLGFSKTGTTSIQQGLNQNRSRLARDGISYVEAGRNGGSDINHHQFATAFGSDQRAYSAGPPQIDQRSLANLIDEVNREIEMSPCRKQVISSELFTNFGLNREAEDQFFNFVRRHDTTFVFYVREQFDWLVSWYYQAAKNGNMGLWLDEFLRAPDQLPNSERFDTNFLRKIDYFANMVGRDRIVVRSYDAARKNLFADFAGIVGFDPGGYEEEQLNASPPDRDVIGKVLKRRIGMEADPAIDLTHVPDAVVDRALLRGRYAFLRDDLKIQVQSRCAAVNAALTESYGVRI